MLSVRRNGLSGGTGCCLSLDVMPALRVGEMTGLKAGDLHLGAKMPYIRIFGKGGKCWIVPTMKRTVQHLRGYLREFHRDALEPAVPLFYALTHGVRHELSDGCIQKVLKSMQKSAGMKEF